MGEMAASKTSAQCFSAVVFDIGGVIVDWNPRYLYRKLIADSARMEWFLTEVCSSAWNAEQDRGRTFAEAIEEVSGCYPQHREWIEAYWSRWPEMLGGPIPGTTEVVGELKRSGTAMFAITNWSAETYPAAVERHPVLELFEDVVVSGEVKLTKPDPAIYHHALDRFGLSAEQALFVDDNRANTEAAAALGMGTVLFTNAAELRDELKRHGRL
ncbi:2-haloacid dehalogenase [Sinosporangium album]|uniref:2-haloacid dehalogenase n=1 Tax=Sinosporangium album TaxID=504805 RepID=A0A1G7YS00_9ACTN|nr:HAD family phosphatase [Sinosporangium album]SDG98670.1 2-haloacid dehalogenase [Sinosporangium album]